MFHLYLRCVMAQEKEERLVVCCWLFSLENNLNARSTLPTFLPWEDSVFLFSISSTQATELLDCRSRPLAAACPTTNDKQVFGRAYS